MKYVFLLLLLFLVCWVKAQDPGRYDVVIHEIFADPAPSRGMPASEFVEIRNRSSTAWNLRNWTLTAGRSTGKISASYILKPDSVVILCGSSAASSYQKYGTTLVVSSFPSLDNDGDTLILSSPSAVIHAVAWTKSWYHHDVKMEGGWSIEMVDRDKPCLGITNWTASLDILGATPGKKNSVESLSSDTVPPVLLYGYFEDSMTAVLQFSEPLKQQSNWFVKTEPLSTPAGISLLPPLFTSLKLGMSVAQKEGSTTRFEITDATDCRGNLVQRGSITTGAFSKIAANDIVVNEILFDPPVGGVDYVELYNRSDKTADVSKLSIANRSSDNRISSVTSITVSPYPLLSGEYLLISTNTDWVLKKYQPPPFQRSAQLMSMPTYPDDMGEVILLNDQGDIIDELNYDAKWHFGLVSDKQGISLERISSEMKTNDPANWHSASTASGYGTPGYKNSQALPDEKTDDIIALSSKIISPDLDGRDDHLFISYRFPSPGNVAYVTAFNSRGMPVKAIATASLCGTTGSFRWDGLTNSGALAPAGVYIILTEVFDLQGKTKKFRHTVAIYR